MSYEPNDTWRFFIGMKLMRFWMVLDSDFVQFDRVLAEGSKNVAVPRLRGSTLVTQKVLEIQNKLG